MNTQLTKFIKNYVNAYKQDEHTITIEHYYNLLSRITTHEFNEQRPNAIKLINKMLSDLAIEPK